MNEYLPPFIQPIIEDYISLVNTQLPGRLIGFYLVGSVALGEFHEHFSDIDFVAIISRKLTGSEVEKLHNIHRSIERTRPRWKMSGSYIQPGDLGKLDHELEPHLQYHDGVLHLNGVTDLNSVTWWELKNHGVAITGDTPDKLLFTVDWNALIKEMRDNLNCYWAGWASQPGRMLVLYSNWGIQWAVLGVLRQFYTFKENSITTKVRAGRYALGCLPICWHKLIQEAINIRAGKKKSAYRFKILRMIEAVNFLKYVIHICNTDNVVDCRPDDAP